MLVENTNMDTKELKSLDITTNKTVILNGIGISRIQEQIIPLNNSTY